MSRRSGGSNAERDVSLISTYLCHNGITLNATATGRIMPDSHRKNESNDQQNYNQDDNHEIEYFRCLAGSIDIRRLHI